MFFGGADALQHVHSGGAAWWRMIPHNTVDSSVGYEKSELSPMPLCVNLYKSTDQGRKTIKDSPKRVRENPASFQRMGVRIIRSLYTTGRHDLVVISEAPNEDTALAAGAAIASAGNVVAETLHAYSVEEFEKAPSEVP
jgi:uncharacterized protein with GYD domain